MIKADLIQRVSEKTGVQKTVVSRVLEAVLTEIIKGVWDDSSVILRGFGTFSCKKERARIGRNFSNGETVDVPEKIVPVFEPGTSFKNYSLESEQC